MIKIIHFYLIVFVSLIFAITNTSCAIKQKGELKKIDISRDASYPRIGVFTNLIGKSRRELNRLSRYSLIIIGCDAVEKEISYLKLRNPNLIVLCFFSPGCEGPSKKHDINSDYWLRDPSGKPIVITSWHVNVPNQTLPEVNDSFITRIQKAFTELPHLDGVYFDCFLTPKLVLAHGRVDSNRDGKADNPDDFKNAWTTGLLRVLKGIRRAKPNAIILAETSAEADFAYNDLNGILFGDAIRGSIYATVKEDKTDAFDKLLASYLKWCGVPRTPRVTVFAEKEKLGVLKDTIIDSEGLVRFYLAFTLMGDGYLILREADLLFKIWWLPPGWDINLGNPLKPVQKKDGYWMRKFEHATVYVNPYPKPAKIKDNDREFLLPAFDGKIITEQ